MTIVQNNLRGIIYYFVLKKQIQARSFRYGLNHRDLVYPQGVPIENNGFAKLSVID